MVGMRWKVVGGGKSGGIIAREGQDLKSEELPTLLARDAIVEQVELNGARLHFRMLDGEGPPEGWVSTKLKAGDLLVPFDSVDVPPTLTKNGARNGYPNTSELPKTTDTISNHIQAKAAECEQRGELAKWCMKYPVLGFPLTPGTCKFRVICFHSAGSAESIWTSPAMNPLLAWVKDSKSVELVAVSYPGRDKLVKSAFHESTETLVDDMLPVLHRILTDGVPFMFLGHSVGTWVAFEVLQLMRKVGMSMPQAALLSAFPAPDMPENERPWRANRNLSDEEFKLEVGSWDERHFTGAAKIVFEEPNWKSTFQPQMRADFRLFDEYRFTHGGSAKFDFPIYSYHMQDEHYVKPDMVKRWGNWTSSKFEFEILEAMGHLTCLYENKSKNVYLSKILQIVKTHANLNTH